MKVLIVDDEALGRKNLRRLLTKHTGIEKVGEASNIQEALLWIQKEAPSVIFLDIQLRGETGFDLLPRLPTDSPRIVFVTAYDQFAIRAFECNVLDYLLKPVEPARLALTLERIRARQEPSRMTPDDEDRALVKSGGEMRWIPWKEILFIQSDGNYTEVFLRGNKRLMVYRPLKSWSGFAPSTFLQIHRRHLVRLSEIERVIPGTGTSKQVLMSSGDLLDIGRSFWPTLKKSLVHHGK